MKLKINFKQMKLDFKQYILKNTSSLNRERATIAELFFDIILIIHIVGVSHNLIHTLANSWFDWTSITFDLFKMTFALYVWKEFMYFSANRFQTIAFRLIMFLIMLALLLLGIPGFFDQVSQNVLLVSYAGYFIALSTIMLSIILYLFNHQEVKIFRIRLFMIVMSQLSSLIIILTMIILTTLNWIVFYKTLSILWIIVNASLWFFDLSTTTKKKSWANTLNPELISDRLFVLLILFIGEGLITLVAIFAQKSQSKLMINDSFWTILIAFALMFCLWWLFRDYITSTKMRHSKLVHSWFANWFLIFLMLVFIDFIGIGVIIDGAQKIGASIFAIAFLISMIPFVLLFKSRQQFNKDIFFLRISKFVIIQLMVIFSGFGCGLFIALFLGNGLLVMTIALIATLISLMISIFEFIYSIHYWQKHQTMFLQKIKKHF